MSGLRIAAIGDSLTQGFMSGAISQTSLSFPAIIARSMGLTIPDDFRIPRFPGSGLPLNLEACLHYISSEISADFSGAADWLFRFPLKFADFADMVEDMYERGPGNQPAAFGGVYHNLAVWGLRAHDSFTLTPKICKSAIENEEGFFKDDFLGLPSGAMYRTASRVLNPRRNPKMDDMTQVTALEKLVADEGVDVLLLFLGANDCLGTVLELEVRDMEDHQGQISDNPVERREICNLTSAKQFKKDYNKMAKKVAAILDGRQTKVFVGTVPHVTIPPVTRGVGDFDGRYFASYARFFMPQNAFNKHLHSHLTRAEAKHIDHRIDSFNDTIADTAEKHGWHVVDTCKALDTLAVRRNGHDGAPQNALIDYYAQQHITEHPLLDLDPVPSILMLETRELGQRIGGGLFSLDGVHPATIGYGIVAELFLKRMQEEGVNAADPRRMIWQQLIQQDALLNDAPQIWDDVVEVAQKNALLWDTLFKVMG